MGLYSEDLLRLVLAILVGALIGGEREFRDKSAGFRTIIFICTGAALFTIFSIHIGGASDRTRIAANIVSGVGFLGAGAIMRDTGRLVGLTTAATIWLVAALGMGIGGGDLVFVSMATVAVLTVLWFFPWIERKIDNLRDVQTYQIVSGLEPDQFAAIQALFAGSRLRVRGMKQTKRSGRLVSQWITTGTPAAHQAFMKELVAHPTVQEFDFQ